MADETVVLGIKVDSTQIEKAGIKLDELKRSASGAEKATDGLTNGYKDLKATLDPVFAVQRQYQSGLKTVREEQKRGNLSLEEATRTTALLTKRYELLTNQINGTGKSFRKLRGAAGNIGFQLQDIAVQAQAGTDAFIIFSQQGSQLASAFGPGGAVLGAVIAVAGALGGVLFNAFNEASGGAKSFGDALSELNKIMIESESGTVTLTDEIVKLAKVSRAAAEIELASGIVKARDAMKSAKDEFSEQLDFTVLRDFGREINLIAGEYDTSINSILNTTVNASELISDEFDISTESATKFVMSLARFRGDSTSENLEGLRSTIRGLITDTDGASDEFISFLSGIAEKAANINVAKERIDAFTKAFNDLNQALKVADEESNKTDKDKLTTVQQMIQALTEESHLLGVKASVTKDLNTQLLIEKASIAKLKESGEALTAAERDALTVLSQIIEKRKEVIKTREDAGKREAAAQKKAIKDANEFYNEVMRLRKENEKLNSTYQQMVDKLDPVGAKFREVARQQKFLIDNQAALRIPDEKLEQLLEALSNTLDTAGEEGSDGFMENFIKGVDGIGDALQSAIMSGDFAGIGNAVGGILANSMANAVQASVGGLAGSVLGGVAGGLIGSAVTGLIDGLMDEFSDPTEARQKSQGAGTILGSIDEKSQSIANSNELIANATGELVGINNNMLTQLSILSGSISDVSARVMQSRQGLSFQAPEMQNLFGGNDIQSGLAGQAIAGSVLDAVLPGLGAILSAGARSRQVDEGIRIIGGQIQDVIDNTVIEGFASFEVRKNFLDDYDRKDRFVALGDEINTQFGQIFSGIVDTVVEGVGVLGVSRDQVMTALDDFLIETQMVSLEGLDAAAQEAAIQSVFSKIFDQVSKEVISDTLPFLEELADGGEGLGETLSRVTTQFLTVKEAAASLGFGFLGTTENLIRASDSLIERLGGLEAFSSAVLSFEKNFLTTEQQLTNQSRRLNDALSAIGEELPETRQGFADLVTGLRHVADVDEEALATLLELGPEAASYYSLLEQSLEDTGDAIEDVVDIVGDLEDAIATAAAAVDSALSGLKASVAAEKAELDKLYRELVKDRKESLADELEIIKESGSDKVDAIKDSEKSILKSLSDEKDAIKDAEKARLKSISDTKDLIKEEEKARLKGNKIALDAARNGLKAITSELDAITSAIAKLQEKSISTEMRRAKAFAMLQKAVATGNLTGAGDAASIASDISQSEFSTGADFRRQVGLTNTLLGQASALGSRQKSTAERSVEALEAQSEAIKQSADDQIKALDAQSEVIKERADQQIDRINDQIDLTKMLADDAIEKAKIETENAITAAREISELELAAMEEDHEASIARLDAIVLEAQNQIDALRGIDSSVKSVEVAVAAFGSAINAERAARQALEQQLAQPEPESPVTATNPYGITLGNIPSISVAPKADQIATFADGGLHGGGLRIVGEEGPELEMTGPSRIINNNDLSKMLSNDEMTAEIKRMREELNRVLMSIARSSGKAAKRLDRWEGDGLPNFREPQEVV